MAAAYAVDLLFPSLCATSSGYLPGGYVSITPQLIAMSTVRTVTLLKVAKKLRSVGNRERTPPVTAERTTVRQWILRCTVAMNHPDDDLPARDLTASDGGREYAALPSRRSVSRTVGLEARPELRDRETYYAQLRYAVHVQSRGIPGVTPVAWSPHLPDTWT